MSRKNIYFNSLFVIIGMIVGVGVTTLVYQHKYNPILSQQNKINTVSSPQFPWLDLSLNYFVVDDVRWGSATGKNTSSMSGYQSAAIENKAVYQSYPTTDIKIKLYSTESKQITYKSLDEVKLMLKKNDPNNAYTDIILGLYNKFGSIQLFFLPERVAEKIDEFDVDGDGKNEKIITTNLVGRADAGSYHSAIIKGNNIIFSADEDNSSIVPAETKNGFYIEWRNSNQVNEPRCCATGFTRTRFIWDGNKFIPIYEQEIKYLKIGKNPYE